MRESFHLKKKIRTTIQNIKNFFKYPAPQKPCMSPNEFELYKSYIDQAKTVIEFGSGGSTVYCLQSGCRVASIESAPWFMRSMKRLPIIKQSISNKKLFYIHGNIGIVGDWGVPIDKHVQGNKYYLKPLQKICNSQKDFLTPDVVFIDGRFRVACLLNTIKQLQNTKKIIMHDYMDRPHYHVIEKYVDIIASIDTLAVFVVKKNIDLQELEKDLAEYRNDYR